MKQRKLTRLVCIILAAVMLLSLVAYALTLVVGAASSKEILKELEALRAEACSTGEMIKLNEEKLPGCARSEYPAEPEQNADARAAEGGSRSADGDHPHHDQQPA